MNDTVNTLIKILIVDPCPVVAAGVMSLLSAKRDFIVDAVYSGQDGIQKARKWKPDIILLDIALPDIPGIKAADQIVKMNPNARVIIFTDLDPKDFLTVAMLRVIRGFLPKNCFPAELIKAIMQVYNNQIYFAHHDISPALQSLIISQGN